MKRYCVFLSIFISVFCFSNNLCAQTADASTIWINVYGDYPASTTIHFGNRIGNTFGLDTLGSYPAEFREQEPPASNIPDTPPGFEVLWIKIRVGQFGTFRGLFDRDYRNYSSPIQTDTFKLTFGQYDNPSATISFKWPDQNYLLAHCDSLYLKYTDTTGPVVINMFSQDSLAIPNAGSRGISTLFIYKYGIHLVETGVEDQQQPQIFSLSQNYPNPFNPSTEFQYSVASRQYVSIKIFDVLGREVTTLVNGMEETGYKSMTWDAMGKPSGVYFYQLQAGTFRETKKMVVIR